MPGGDGSGPRSEGPLTGRGAGICAGYPKSGYETAPGCRGGRSTFGRRGGGRGFRDGSFNAGLHRPRWNSQYQAPSCSGQEAEETESLKRRVQLVADAIERIAHHVNELLRRRTEGIGQ